MIRRTALLALAALFWVVGFTAINTPAAALPAVPNPVTVVNNVGGPNDRAFRYHYTQPGTNCSGAYKVLAVGTTSQAWVSDVNSMRFYEDARVTIRYEDGRLQKVWGVSVPTGGSVCYRTMTDHRIYNVASRKDIHIGVDQYQAPTADVAAGGGGLVPVPPVAARSVTSTQVGYISGFYTNTNYNGSWRAGHTDQCVQVQRKIVSNGNWIWTHSGVNGGAGCGKSLRSWSSTGVYADNAHGWRLYSYGDQDIYPNATLTLCSTQTSCRSM